MKINFGLLILNEDYSDRNIENNPIVSIEYKE